jgi:polyhydroxybutyrate depolymerase
VLLAAACGSPRAADGPDAASATADAATAAPPADARVCLGKQAQPTDKTYTLRSGGLDRTFDVHVPASYDPTRPTPLVFDFHGYTMTSQEEILLTGMNAKADRAGFIAVHPEGTGTTPSWNAGACCGDAALDKVDDVAFVRAMLDDLEVELCVDERRVYSAGMSDGAFLSHRLGCELSDRIAAIAPVAGVLGVPTCTPSRPVPVMHFHGTADPLVPYGGSPTLGFPPVLDTFRGWATRDACTGDPTITFEKGDARCQTYAHCDGGAEVTLCTITDGGHTWPGGLPVPALGKTTTDLDATDAMWTFFQAHPMP